MLSVHTCFGSFATGLRLCLAAHTTWSCNSPDAICIGLGIESLKVSEDLIPRADMIRYLGVYMDANLNFKQHVTKKCKAAMLNYFKIKSIRPLLDVKTTARYQ